MVLNIPEADLTDLRTRLRNTRWATPWPLPPWEAGTDGGTLRRLVEYWASDYDWREHEAAINALPHHVGPVPYLRFGQGFPLLLANGWPSTFLELVDVAERLAAAGFTVIVPSLPGYGTAPQRAALAEAPHTHDLWHTLMHDELGFSRYGVHGSDIGAGDASRLAQAYPEAVAGLHLLDTANPAAYDPAGLTDEERAYLDAENAWAEAERGYSHEQQTRPLTLAQGLSDSPSGLLAWILEKYRAWSDDFAAFSDDFVLTQASLYWFTNSISTSFRPYYERAHQLVPTVSRVDVPTAYARFPADLGARKPRSWVERTYPVARYTLMPRGGHFAAHEEPALLADDITAFFTALPR
ncbi:putative hydrolase or acyltransferase of alpha/beta superfamily [Cryptosporangium arvum DSM 44712]|uniref:Putative hydrolase or acyltransferase of alpha/beta superfamily n=1 Tax=Cryptosporangium arvum DSM 44712 TaxID=927661 RepID=A0A010ZRA2_9ACTN|nr:putative hydrolase or acyltransferase of alpha/beta superfamily [Cryptosporangium arvum DSM 44712]